MTKPSTPDPDGTLFDAIYATTRGGDPRDVPWAHAAPHPMLQPWLESAEQPPDGSNRALVIGSGLGDDAEALALLGWDVTAFDISEQAIAWTRERFSRSAVDYRVLSLFDLPEAWRQAFDFVLEIHTIQALPVTRRQTTIRAIAATVAPSGELMVIAITRHTNVPLRGRPWPLTDAEMRSFTRYGLVETRRFAAAVPSTERPGRVRCHLTRPS